MDFLSLERIWEDEDFFEIEIIAKSRLICASVRSYTTDKLMLELALRLSAFPQNSDERFIWENGRKGDDSTPFISLEFWCADKLGHITIEVYMEIDDGGLYSKHNCCFFVETEIGLLNNFGKSLRSLNESGIGKKIILNQTAE